MTATLLAPEASQELTDAAVWYESRRTGLGSEFLDESQRVLASIGSNPASFPRVGDLPPDLEIRRALFPRFPFAAVFLRKEDEIRVLAFAHHKRRPNFWLSRVEE